MPKTTCGPLARTDEERMARLTELLSLKEWRPVAAAFILAGVDPGEDPVALWSQAPVSEWNLLPGLDRPVDPEQAEAFDEALVERVRQAFSLAIAPERTVH